MYLIFILVIFIQGLAHESQPLPPMGLNTPIEVYQDLHAPWQRILDSFVSDSGNVDYRNLKNSSAALQAYLESLSQNPPGANTSRNEKLAYFINLYNAATVKLVLDHYPVQSIKDIQRPWERKWIVLGDELVSLSFIENEILRKMNEPRIHFAINCASVSCPALSKKAYNANLMEQQLEAATSNFIRDPSHNRIESDSLLLSSIFKWYEADFTQQGSLRDYVAPYTKVEIGPNPAIDYLNYDWRLNED